MMTRILVRGLHLAMVVYLSFSAVELLDRSGVASDYGVVSETAETLREVRAGDDPLGIGHEVERSVDALGRLGDALNQAGEALE